MMPTGAHASVVTSRAPKASQGRVGIAYDSTARPSELRNKGSATCHLRSPAAQGTEWCCHALHSQKTIAAPPQQFEVRSSICKQNPSQHASKSFAGLRVGYDTCSLSVTQQACMCVVSRAATCGLAVLGVE